MASNFAIKLMIICCSIGLFCTSHLSQAASKNILYEKPVWSPTGNELVFYSNLDGDYDIWIFNLLTQEASKLTNNKAKDIFPTWSPSEKEIAFLSDRNGTLDLWIIDIETREERNLSQNVNGKVASDYHWSNNGKYIAFIQFDTLSNTSHIMLAQLEDGTISQLTSEENIIYPGISWSPEDDFITFIGAYKNSTNNERHVGVISLDGAKKIILANRRDIAIYWIPNDKIVLLDDTDLTLWFFDPKEEKLQHLIDYTGIVSIPTFSPGGSKLAVSLIKNGNQDIWIIDTIQNTGTNITSDIIGIKLNPSWSPTGQQIAFEYVDTEKTSLAFIRSDILVMNLNGSYFSLSSLMEN